MAEMPVLKVTVKTEDKDKQKLERLAGYCILVGVASIVAGVGIAFGYASAFITAGVFCVVIGVGALAK